MTMTENRSSGVLGQRLLRRPLDHRSVRDGIRKGHPHFEHVGAGVREPLQQGETTCAVRMSRRGVAHQGAPVGRAERCESLSDHSEKIVADAHAVMVRVGTVHACTGERPVAQIIADEESERTRPHSGLWVRRVHDGRIISGEERTQRCPPAISRAGSRTP